MSNRDLTVYKNKEGEHTVYLNRNELRGVFSMEVIDMSKTQGHRADPDSLLIEAKDSIESHQAYDYKSYGFVEGSEEPGDVAVIYLRIDKIEVVEDGVTLYKKMRDIRSKLPPKNKKTIRPKKRRIIISK